MTKTKKCNSLWKQWAMDNCLRFCQSTSYCNTLGFNNYRIKKSCNIMFFIRCADSTKLYLQTSITYKLNDETISQLLLHCSTAWSLWNSIFGVLVGGVGVSHIGGGWVGTYTVKRGFGGKKDVKILWKMVIFYVLFYVFFGIWIQHNAWFSLLLHMIFFLTSLRASAMGAFRVYLCLIFVEID